MKILKNFTLRALCISMLLANYTQAAVIGTAIVAVSGPKFVAGMVAGLYTLALGKKHYERRQASSVINLSVDLPLDDKQLVDATANEKAADKRMVRSIGRTRSLIDTVFIGQEKPADKTAPGICKGFTGNSVLQCLLPWFFYKPDTFIPSWHAQVEGPKKGEAESITVAKKFEGRGITDAIVRGRDLSRVGQEASAFYGFSHVILNGPDNSVDLAASSGDDAEYMKFATTFRALIKEDQKRDEAEQKGAGNLSHLAVQSSTPRH